MQTLLWALFIVIVWNWFKGSGKWWSLPFDWQKVVEMFGGMTEMPYICTRTKSFVI